MAQTMNEAPTSNPIEHIRSAGVTAAATLGILGSVSALLVWGWFFLSLLSIPVDRHGKHYTQLHPFAVLVTAMIPPLLIAMGIRISIGLFQLRPWARRGALVWAALALLFSASVIAFYPYETFVIREDLVTPVVSFKQLLAFSFVIFTFPVAGWCLLYFTRRRVIAQFDLANSANPSQASRP
jgi:hypothetical protein